MVSETLATDDPRVRPECVERIPREDGPVTLVGVVHDHPASCHRVQTLIEAIRPDVLALELPPLAVPLARRQADDERTPPTLGGEMSAAVQAADTDDVVGIDGPSVGFLRSLAGALYRERASPSTVVKTARAVRAVATSALCSRLGAAVDALTPLHVAGDLPTDYDTGDDPQRQAADERERVRRAASMLGAFSPPAATDIRRRTRESHMARRLAAIDGETVAVVGMAHLDPVADRLRDT